jgi:nucleoside-diphosphate-sugar epimerase
MAHREEQIVEQPAGRAPGAGCPVCKLVRYLLALAAGLCPQPALNVLRRHSAAAQLPIRKERPGAALHSSRCPFLRLMLVLGMQTLVSAATHPVRTATGHSAMHVRRATASAASARVGASAAGAPVDGSDRRVLILGGGWVGSRVANHFAATGAAVTVTYRNPESIAHKPSYFKPARLHPSVQQARFELESAESWANLPAAEGLTDVIVTFPLTDTETALAFHDHYLRAVRNVLVCSSTSVYDVRTPGALVTEETALKEDTARGQVEERLRQRGATLLALGGIFGDGSSADAAYGELASDEPSERTVCSCLAMHTTHAPVTSAHKLINMVHVDDIVASMVACVRTPQPAARINLVSCTFSLADLVDVCGLDVGARVDASLEADTSSKRICNAKLVRLLPDDHRLKVPWNLELNVRPSNGAVAQAA